MNFKTIFSVAILALVASVNAAPHRRSLEDQIATIKKECRSDNEGKAIFKMMDDNLVYACLRGYNSNKKFNVVTPNNSACFYFDEKVFCIDDDHSNIEECSKSHVKYNYEICGRYVLNLTRYNGPNHLYARLRNYPDKSKIELNPRLDAEECKENGGIQLKYQNVFQYICVLPDSGKEDLSNKIILTVDEKPYYVYTDNTNIDLCIETSQNYNKEQCLFLINLIGKTDNINVKTIN
ncbi:hypothetical protein BCR32DRAFT_308232 [Anaeromyces robustus]|uniref:Uncharacterized protein n=1 Tax=Anaeromyces robustus TaxID=1754192 RepID=A0A1Y1VDK2_9FUNG|nr:hypothetical protein BCR32DRAFT_308232 [Anaeromyces robustus]|eukprot:ORX53469.1 hypothetical protein BCR32DRAFT_308232 [Anaeromyces robustus]